MFGMGPGALASSTTAGVVLGEIYLVARRMRLTDRFHGPERVAGWRPPVEWRSGGALTHSNIAANEALGCCGSGGTVVLAGDRGGMG